VLDARSPREGCVERPIRSASDPSSQRKGRKRRLFVTTSTVDAAVARPASIGLSGRRFRRGAALSS
jgi:hypothetical protein